MNKILRHVPLLGALLLTSCEKAEVKTYTETAEAVAPRQAAQPRAPMMGMPGKAAPLPQGTDSIVGAIFREPEAMWFFKVVGSSEATAALGQTLDSFLGSFDFKGQEASWTLPGGWSEIPGEGFRYRSFKVEGQTLDISLTRMPAGNDLTANLNRWAGQLGLGPLSEEQLQAACSEKTLQQHKVLMVRLSKNAAKSAAPAPAPAAPIAPVAKETPAPSFRFVTPPLWQQKAPTSMRLINLSGPDGAELTVSSMTLGNPVLQLGAMWSSQVGLPEPDAAAMAKMSWPCSDIAGIKAEGWIFEGKERFVRVARVDQAGASWYFKLSGPLAAKSQIAAYEAFLKSFSFEVAK